MDSDYESSSVIYDDENEDQKDYRPGGYHPVQEGELFFNRYIVVQKLGWGHFSTVWLCKDTKHGTYVAMKVQKSAENYTEAAMDEIDLLRVISSRHDCPLWVQSLQEYGENVSRDSCYVVQLLNSFTHSGPHGVHVCMVFEILGVNLLELIKLYQYKGIPISICRAIARQVLVGLDYLHRVCGIIHTDLKPENVLLQLNQSQLQEILGKGQLLSKISMPTAAETPQSDEALVEREETPEEARKRKRAEKKRRYRQKKRQQKRQSEPDLKVKIADLGNACWLYKHYSIEIQTRQYRSPEVILGITYNPSADLWSFACMLFELLTGDFLFEPRMADGLDKDEDHLAQMVETLGMFPKDWALSGQFSKKFLTKTGELRNVGNLKVWMLKDVLAIKYRFKPEEAQAFCDFVMPMLAFKPEERATAQESLKHPWLYSKTTELYMNTQEHQLLLLKHRAKEEELIERLESGEDVSSPDVPREYSPDADVEDTAADESDWSPTGETCMEFQENLEYHRQMAQMRFK